MNYVANGNVYAVVSESPTAAGQACSGFMVGSAGSEVEGSGYKPRTLSYTSPVRYTCTIYDATHVVLVRTDPGGTWASPIDILYDAGPICVTTNGNSNPTDEQCVGGLITGNEGVGGTSPSMWQGMPAQPVRSPTQFP